MFRWDLAQNARKGGHLIDSPCLRGGIPKRARNGLVGSRRGVKEFNLVCVDNKVPSLGPLCPVHDKQSLGEPWVQCNRQ